MKKNSAKARILIIEDDPGIVEVLQQVLKDKYDVETAATAEEGIELAKSKDFYVVITDLQMPGLSGRDVITTLRPDNPHLPIILITGYHSPDTVIETTKLGAYDYIPKPIGDFKEFLEKIDKAVASSTQFRESQLQSREAKARMRMGEETFAKDAIIGRSPAMQDVYKEIGRVAAMPVTVLIRGETGTGKELVARALREYSNRTDDQHHPFVIVNCVAIPETLLESELFGHEQGAFTGAQTRRIGKFERANKGTIFLDEIGDMSLSTQAKLLRVLQEKTIQRVGGKEPISVDVRVIAATHRELEQAVEERKFRADLYYRLNDAVIRLPSLRERREDIPRVVNYFLSRLAEELAIPKPTITEEALRLLKYRRWPGNVRELKNAVHKAVVLAHGYPIDPEIVRQTLGETNPSDSDTKRTLQAYVVDLLDAAEREARTDVEALFNEWVERELYGQAIRLAEGDQTRVAKWLGVSRPTVRERLQRYGLHPASDRSSASE